MSFIARAALFLLLSFFVMQPANAQVIPGLSSGTASEESSAEDPAQEPDVISGQVDALVDLLRNPGVLDALTERLAASEAPVEVTPEPVENDPPASFGRRIANVTTDAAEDVARSANRLWLGISRLPTIIERSLGAFDQLVLMTALTELALVVVITYAVFLTLRYLGRRYDLRIARRVNEANGAVLFAFALLASFKDLVIAIVAGAAGYGLLLVFTRNSGGIGETQALYLNAFLLVEATKILIRTVLSPRVSALRLVRLPDWGAVILARWLTVCTTILGYGLMLVVPLVNVNASVLAGSATGTVISIAVVLSALVMVLYHRKAITAWLIPRNASRRGIVRVLISLWIVPTVIYLLGLLAIVATRPGGILVPLLQSTAIILGAIILAMITLQFLTGAIARGVRLPESWKMRFPLLERRLNSFVPKILWVLRFVLFIVVIGVILSVLGVFDFREWASSDLGAMVLSSGFSVLLITIVAFAIWLLLSSWVEFRLNPDFGKAATAREQTLLTLLRNAATIALLIITAMIVLSELGLNIGPLLASAGVLGLAIGFGAQKMVQDIITGVFIQFENAINVGDVISVGGITGAVERLTVRSVSLRDLHGVFHIIPFSSVDLVSNYMREFSFYVCDMGIAYREDIDDAKLAMHDAFDELKREEAGRDILGDLEWFGLNSFGDSAIVVRARIKTLPGQQWGIGRAYNLILKRMFDERSIEIPFPHQTIYFGEDKQGKAPPMRVLSEQVQAARETPKPEEFERRETERPETTVENDPHKHMPESDETPDGGDAPR